MSSDIAHPQPVEKTVEQDFERRLADCSALAYRVALGVLHSPADAEDVAQEAFVRAYHHFEKLRDRDRFRGWLVRCTWRLAIDRQRSAERRERREQTAFEIEPPAARSVEQSAASREFQRRVDAALDALPEDLRRVAILAARRMVSGPRLGSADSCALDALVYAPDPAGARAGAGSRHGAPCAEAADALSGTDDTSHPAPSAGAGGEDASSRERPSP